MNDREVIRVSYKPNPIKILFIAESPPEGAHFFYTIDTLTLHTQQAFADVFNEVKDMSGEEFLDYFRKVGCYLEDLCTKPVNKMEPTEREETRRASIPELAKRLKTYESKSLKAIFIIMKDIKPHVKDALGRTKIKTSPDTLSFPGRPRDVEDYKQSLVKLLKENIALFEERQ